MDIQKDDEVVEQYYSYEDEFSLSVEQIALLKRQNSRPVSAYQVTKAESDSKKHWDQFYKRNEARFFKDRHWIEREWPELVKYETVLEVGCGSGNLLFPLLAQGVRHVWACDLSPRAVELVKSHSAYSKDLVTSFQTDITENNCWLQANFPDIGVGAATLVFVLSAVPPSKMMLCLTNIFDVLKPGGLLFFRDYGRGDMAQLRFGPSTKISENRYLRQDGTQSYFFSLSEVREMFSSIGFHVKNLCYVHRRTVNKKEGINVPRIFVQGEFLKS